jgi:hypothetical protein
MDIQSIAIRKNRRRARGQQVRTIMKAILVYAALGALLGACTLVTIEGGGNSVSDTGGHGGGLTIPTQQPALGDRLRGLSEGR